MGAVDLEFCGVHSEFFLKEFRTEAVQSISRGGCLTVISHRGLFLTVGSAPLDQTPQHPTTSTSPLCYPPQLVVVA